MDTPADGEIRLARPGNRSRLLALAYGLVVFVWLGLEDSALLPVVLLGTGLAALVVVLWVMARVGGRTLSLRGVLVGLVWVGALIGGGASVAITLLMFFKTARHAHVLPDYPVQQMLDMLARTPIWMVAGGLAGLAVAFVWLAMRPSSHD